MKTLDSHRHTLFSLLAALTVCLGVCVPSNSVAAPVADQPVADEQAHWSESGKSSDHAASPLLVDRGAEVDADPELPGIGPNRSPLDIRRVPSTGTPPDPVSPVVVPVYGPAIYRIAPCHGPPA